MLAFNGLGHLRPADSGIDLGGLEIAMAEQPLHVSEIGPALDKMSGAGVTPKVGPAWSIHASQFLVITDQNGDGLFLHRAVWPN